MRTRRGVKAGRAARAWLWVFASLLVVVFRIDTRRGSQVPKQVLGEGFTGFLISDRWAAYNWYDPGLLGERALKAGLQWRELGKLTAQRASPGLEVGTGFLGGAGAGK